MVIHQLQVERRTGKVRRPKTDALSTEPRHQQEMEREGREEEWEETRKSRGKGMERKERGEGKKRRKRRKEKGKGKGRWEHPNSKSPRTYRGGGVWGEVYPPSVEEIVEQLCPSRENFF